MRLRPVRTAAATTEIGLGLLAVLLSSIVVTFFVDPFSLDLTRGLLVGSCLMVGGGLFGFWMAARTRRGWLLVLAVTCGSLGVSMIVITAQLYGRVRADEHAGIWTILAGSALAVGFWLVITAAAVVEWRVVPRVGEEESRTWIQAGAVVAPLALITAFVVLLVSAGPGWLIRLNSEVGEVRPAVDGPGSELSGEARWTIELASKDSAVALATGIAVPVPRDRDHSAGVVLLDPVDGGIRWRHQLKGADEAPTLASTDGGRALVVEPGRVDEDMARNTFTLDGETGQVQGVWPERGEVADTDPPVLFDHVARGTNSVIAISPTGRKLWTHRPERCADPRSVTSTHEVMLVRARRCDESNPALQMLGLDARTGKQRWVQNLPEDAGGKPIGGEDGPSEVVVGADHQVELAGGHLGRRNLATGAMDWTAAEVRNCTEPGLRGGGEVVYVTCGGDDRNPASVTAYETGTGRSLWQQRVPEPMVAVTAVDDERVLALTSGPKACTLRLVDASGERDLLELPGGDAEREPGPDDVRCRDAQLLRSEDSLVLRVRLASAAEETYRFIGLE